MWTTSIVAFPCDIVEDGHCTVEFLGETTEIGATADEIKEQLASIDVPDSMEVQTLGLRIFGMKTGEPVWVLLLDAHDLKPIQEQVVSVLRKFGVENKSSYANEEYKPHVTIQPFESYLDLENLKNLPETVTLGPLELWWNEERTQVS